MSLSIYQVDAFTSTLFTGNPAAICPLSEWIPDHLMQSIAAENNLAETAFFVSTGDKYEIRWFTPSVEVDLCGHATLASAYILFHELGVKGDKINFFSPRSGALNVSRDGEMLTLDFPTDSIVPIPLSNDLLSCFSVSPAEAFKGKTDYMVVFDSEEEVRVLRPILPKVARLNIRGLIATAKGTEVDFVSRFFAPQSGIDEDPATGSAHTTLTPYWSGRLGKKVLTAQQLSSRQGWFTCTNMGDRTLISGKAKMYMRGTIDID